MPSNKNAVTRYQIIDRLLANRYNNYSIGDITKLVNEELEEMGIKPVTKRTIEMDINYLEDKGPFYVDIDRYEIEEISQKDLKPHKKTCLRYVDHTFSIFKKKLTEDEQFLLSEALSLLGQFDGLPDFEGLESLRGKVEIKDRPRIVAFDKNPLEGTTVFGQLFTAIAQKTVVELHLHVFQAPNEEIIYKVHPYLLKEYNRRWYLFGADFQTDTIMNFALDRIDSVVPLPTHKFVSCDCDLDERFEEIIGVTYDPDKHVQEIVFWVSDRSKDYVATKPLHDSQCNFRSEREKDLRQAYPQLPAGAFFSIKCCENYELLRELSSFGKELIVLSPKEIQKAIFDKIGEMCERYKDVIG